MNRLFIFLIAFIPLPTTGNVFCGTGENNTGIGATAWTSPTNITADDNATASNTAAASSQYLVARNFNFSSIPSNAKILGITVRIAAAETSTGSETLSAQLQNDVGTLFGSSKTASINGTAETVYTYGTSTDIWGLSNSTVPQTISAAIVKDPDFGVRFWYTTSHNMTVDYVTMSVDYSVGGGFFTAVQ